MSSVITRAADLVKDGERLENLAWRYVKHSGLVSWLTSHFSGIGVNPIENEEHRHHLSLPALQYPSTHPHTNSPLPPSIDLEAMIDGALAVRSSFC